MGWAAAAGPLATVIGNVGGAIVGGRAQGKAADTQLQATREALAFEREKEAAAQRQWEARQARLAPFRMGGVGLLQKYYGPDFYAQSQQFASPVQSGPTLNAAGRSLAQLALQRRMGVGEAPMPEDPTAEPVMEFDPEAWTRWRG